MDLPPEKSSTTDLGVFVSWIKRKEAEMWKQGHTAERIIGELREAEVVKAEGRARSVALRAQILRKL